MAFDIRILLLITMAALASACNGELARELSSGPSAVPGGQTGRQQPAPTPTPAPTGSCRVLIPEEVFSRFVAEKGAMLDNAFVEPGPLETCFAGGKASAKGYSSLTVYPPLEVAGDVRYVNGELEVPVQTASLDEGFRAKLASEFALPSKDAEALTLRTLKESDVSFESDAAPDSLPRVKVRRKQVGRETSLVLSRKKKIKEKRAKAFIEAFAAGRKSIRAYIQGGGAAGPDQETGAIQLHARDHKGKNRYKRASKLELLADFWARAELAQPDPAEGELGAEAAGESPDQDRSDVLRIALQWRYQLSRLPRERVRESLAAMREFAARRWLTDGVARAPKPALETAEDDLTALEFLGAFDGQEDGVGPVAVYYHQYRRLQPYFGYDSSPYALAHLTEIQRLVEQGTLTEAQQEVVHGIAGLMTYEATGNPAHWELAKELCARLGFDTKKLERFRQLLSHVVAGQFRPDWREASEALVALVLRRPNLPDAKVSLFSQVFSWLAYEEGGGTFSSAAAMITHAECLVLDRAITEEKLNLLREGYRTHLNLGLSPQAALEHTESELLKSACPVAAPAPTPVPVPPTPVP